MGLISHYWGGKRARVFGRFLCSGHDDVAMAAPCPKLGDGVTDDTLLHIARFLATPRDLLSLQLTCPRFATKCIATPSVNSGGAAGGPAVAPEMLSIPEEAARWWVVGCSEQERGWVSYRTTESWLGLMHEVGVLRLPLAFGRAHGDYTITENGALATKRTEGDGSSRAAASKAVMRSGRHFAQFTCVVGEGDYLSGDTGMNFGVIRPGWNVAQEGQNGGGEEAYGVVGHCFYYTPSGDCWPDEIEWGGSPADQGDHIGMLLDLDQGSMTVWKNDVKMGVMVAEGLSGPLCWAVAMFDLGDSARIESAALPAHD